MVLLYPLFNRKEQSIGSTDLNIFVGPDYLITIHDGTLQPLTMFRDSFQHDPSLQKRFAGSPVRLLHEVIDRLAVSLFPMLDHISIDINQAEHQISNGREKYMVSEIARVRRNITDFRRIVQTHKNTLKRLIEALKLSRIEDEATVPLFAMTIDRAKEIWDLLESDRESIETLYETNESMISYKLNDIMRTFTTMSVVIFVMTLVATMFSVRARNTPFLESPFAFWLLVGFMLLVGLLAREFFKRKRLLE
jgi:magnesium transporter